LLRVTELIPQYDDPKDTASFRYRIFTDIYNTFVLVNIALHMCGLTLDRYLVMFRPYRYKFIVTTRSILQYIIISWLFSFTISVLQCYWLHRIIGGQIIHTTAFCDELDRIGEFDFWYSTISIVLFFALPFVLLGVAFTRMFIEVRYIISYTAHTSRTYYRQLRVLYVFALMYISFNVLVLPYFSMRLFLDINAYNGVEKRIDPMAHDVMATLRNLTSIVNPLLYAGTCPKFKSVLREIVSHSQDFIGPPNTSFLEFRRISKLSFEFNRAVLQSTFLKTGKPGGNEEFGYDDSGGVEMKNLAGPSGSGCDKQRCNAVIFL